jgi:hypothetical protein
MSHGEYVFSSPVSKANVRVYGYEFADDDHEMSGALVKWRCILESREWGFASIMPVVDDIDMTLDFKQLKSIIKWVDWEVDCQCDQVGRRSTKDAQLHPIEVVVDFDYKQITIWFRV